MEAISDCLWNKFVLAVVVFFVGASSRPAHAVNSMSVTVLEPRVRAT